MTDPATRHGEVVHHMRRHTELRRKAAEEAARVARGEPVEEDEDGDAEAGGG